MSVKTSTEVQVACPHCVRPLSFPVKFLGLSSPCPYCKGYILRSAPSTQREATYLSPPPNHQVDLLKRLVTLLRWLAILPASLLAAALAGGVVMRILGSGAL